MILSVRLIKKIFKIQKLTNCLKKFCFCFFQKKNFSNFFFRKIFQKKIVLCYIFFDENFKFNINEFVLRIDTHDRNSFHVYK